VGNKEAGPWVRGWLLGPFGGNLLWRVLDNRFGLAGRVLHDLSRAPVSLMIISSDEERSPTHQAARKIFPTGFFNALALIVTAVFSQPKKKKSPAAGSACPCLYVPFSITSDCEHVWLTFVFFLLGQLLVPRMPSSSPTGGDGLAMVAPSPWQVHMSLLSVCSWKFPDRRIFTVPVF